jgi:hypothetical protein
MLSIFLAYIIIAYMALFGVWLYRNFLKKIKINIFYYFNINNIKNIIFYIFFNKKHLKKFICLIISKITDKKLFVCQCFLPLLAYFDVRANLKTILLTLLNYVKELIVDHGWSILLVTSGISYWLPITVYVCMCVC